MDFYKVVIADDHTIIIDGIKLMLDGEEKYELVDYATTIPGLISILEKHNSDLALLDINMSEDNMLDYVEDIKKRFPNVKMLIISSYHLTTLINSTKQKGLDGYILKNIKKPDLLEVFEIILKGGTHFVSKSSSPFLKEPTVSTSPLPRDIFAKKEMLSEREIEVIILIVEGKTEQGIADILNISKHTVHSHRKNILKKLKLRTAVDIVRFAYEAHIVEN